MEIKETINGTLYVEIHGVIIEYNKRDGYIVPIMQKVIETIQQTKQCKNMSYSMNKRAVWFKVDGVDYEFSIKSKQGAKLKWLFFTGTTI